MRAIVATGLLLCWAVHAIAEETWEPLPGMRSEKLALAQWDLIESSGFDLPQGPVIVTFWQLNPDGLLLRCLDYFDTSMRSTGGRCDQAMQN